MTRALPLVLTPCERCHGLGFIRTIDLLLDEVSRGAPQTATVTKVNDPEVCPECNGKGKTR